MFNFYSFNSDYQYLSQHGSEQSRLRILDPAPYHPGQYCPVISKDRQGYRCQYVRWGNDGVHHIYHKHAFHPVPIGHHNPIKQACRRYLIPASAFYFSTPDNRSWRCNLGSEMAFCFAAIGYELVNARGETSKHAAILTSTAEGRFRDFHGLMPIVIPRSYEQAWLNTQTPRENLQKCLNQTSRLPFSIHEVQYLQEQDQQWSELAA